VTTPKRKSAADLDVRSLARGYTDLSIKTLGGIAQNGTSDAARVAACAQLLDRGWGKAAQPVTGAGGEDIQVTIRTIIGAAEVKK
jgi:hypothetical protein